LIASTAPPVISASRLVNVRWLSALPTIHAPPWMYSVRRALSAPGAWTHSPLRPSLFSGVKLTLN
jgi:hypothetical protein